MPASVMPWISAGLGGLGLLEQTGANRADQNAAQQQLALQEALIGQQVEGYRQYRDLFDQAVQGGQFNPSREIATANADRAYSESQALGNEAAQARALGHRPGDTTPLGLMNALRGDYALKAAQDDNAIRNQAFAREMSAAAPLLPGSTGSAIAALGENYRTDLGMEQGLGPMLQALGPLLLRSSSSQDPSADQAQQITEMSPPPFPARKRAFAMPPSTFNL